MEFSLNWQRSQQRINQFNKIIASKWCRHWVIGKTNQSRAGSQCALARQNKWLQPLKHHFGCTKSNFKLSVTFTLICNQIVGCSKIEHCTDTLHHCLLYFLFFSIFIPRKISNDFWIYDDTEHGCLIKMMPNSTHTLWMTWNITDLVIFCFLFLYMLVSGNFCNRRSTTAKLSEQKVSFSFLNAKYGLI